MTFELAFVIRLEFCLLAWQKRADGIINEMQWQLRIDAVA